MPVLEREGEQQRDCREINIKRYHKPDYRPVVKRAGVRADGYSRENFGRKRLEELADERDVRQRAEDKRAVADFMAVQMAYAHEARAD